MGEQLNNLLPHQFIKTIRSYLLNITDAFATKAVGIGSNATIIGIVPTLAFGRCLADFFTVIGVVTMAANGQALKQVNCTMTALTSRFAIFGKLFLNRLK
ncbi:hypothetical protein D3C72_1416630 [compost metagenome]